MLEYEWGNPSNIMLTGNEEGGGGGAAPTGSTEQSQRQMMEQYVSHGFLPDHSFLHGPTTTTNNTNINMNMDLFHSHHHHQHHFTPQPPQHHTFFDPRAFPPYPPPHQLSLQETHHHGLMMMVQPKSEEDVHVRVGRPVDFVGSRIGLNLGGRTYFSSSEDDFVSRLYRRSRPPDPVSSNAPRCQVEGCNVDLSQAKHYHRRHKVCEFHSKASTVITMGLTQRFCQQCSRFHLLAEFDNGKRSCRKRLADHNRRRRKTPQQTQPPPDHQIHKSHPHLDNHLPRSPPESGAQSSSSVTVAVSPPDYFRQRPYQSTSPSTTSSSLFFSSGS